MHDFCRLDTAMRNNDLYKLMKHDMESTKNSIGCHHLLLHHPHHLITIIVVYCCLLFVSVVPVLVVVQSLSSVLLS